MALELTIQPNEAQQSALDLLQKTRREGKTKGLVVMATGTGKTILAALDTLQAESKTILFVVHRNEINYQAVEEFSRVRGKDESVGFVNGDLKEFDKPIIFATIQTLSRPENLERIQRREFDYFIIDESHHIAAPSYQNVVSAVKAKFTLGLTATPERLKEGHVKQFFDNNVVFDLGLKNAIESKILVPFIYYGLHDNIDYSDIEWKGYKYSEKDLNKKLVIDERDNEIVKQFQYYCGARQTMGFCVNVRHANIMAAKFNKLGIKATAITHQTPKEQRKQAIEAFRKREIQVIFTKDIFNEGVDFPTVEALLFMRPTFSPIVFFQQLGRGLRKIEGKMNVLVLDFIGNEHNVTRKIEWLKNVGINLDSKDLRMRDKPEINLNISQVWFDSSVLEIFKKNPGGITDEMLLNELLRINSEYGKLSERLVEQYGEYSSQTYVLHFGSFNRAVKLIGLMPNKFNKKVPIEELILEIKRLHEQFGRVTIDIIRNYSKYSERPFVSNFGSLNKALIAAGLKPNRMACQATNDELINDLKRLQSQFGKVTISIISNYGKYSPSVYEHRFGSTNKALILAGLEPKYTKRLGITNKEMLEDVKRVYNEKGYLTVSSYDKYGMYKTRQLHARFGSMNQVKAILGIPITKTNIATSMDELKANYYEVKKKLGRMPKISEINDRSLSKISGTTYRNRCGSWSNFLKEIGEA